MQKLLRCPLTLLNAISLVAGCLILLATSRDDKVLQRVGLLMVSASASYLLARYARYIEGLPRPRNDEFTYLALDPTDENRTIEKGRSWTSSMIVTPLRWLSFGFAVLALLALLGALRFWRSAVP